MNISLITYQTQKFVAKDHGKNCIIVRPLLVRYVQHNRVLKLKVSYIANARLTYPEFHFETEFKVDGLTGVQQYSRGTNVLNRCLQYSGARCIGHQIAEGVIFKSK